MNSPCKLTFTCHVRLICYRTNVISIMKSLWVHLSPHRVKRFHPPSLHAYHIINKLGFSVVSLLFTFLSLYLKMTWLFLVTHLSSATTHNKSIWTKLIWLLLCQCFNAVLHASTKTFDLWVIPCQITQYLGGFPHFVLDFLYMLTIGAKICLGNIFQVIASKV